MSYHERRSIMYALSTLIITGVYFVGMLPGHPDANPYSPEVFRFWGTFFLILIPVSIVARIIIHILFSIFNTIATREEEPAIEDERDRLIDLKATRNSMVAFALGFVLAMVSLTVDWPPSVMFIILLGAGMVSELVSDITQFVLYRRVS